MPWINFDELRKKLPFEKILKAYGAELTPRGSNGQWVGLCPLPEHGPAKKRTFSANVVKGVWQCFGCRASGNIIDFCVIMERCDKRDGPAVKRVAQSLQERFLGAEKPENRKPQPPSKGGLQTVVNQPLDFELKTLDPHHRCFTDLRLAPDTVTRFGLGYCSRGTLKDRVAIPLRDDAEQLVGYGGLSLDSNSSWSSRYTFPSNREHDGVNHVFDRSKFLYNGHRITESPRDLIVVVHCHAVWSLWQGGFGNVVALMGHACSEEQVEYVNLITAANARIWLLTGKDAHPIAETVLMKLTKTRLCRWVQVETEDDIAPDHPLLAALPKR